MPSQIQDVRAIRDPRTSEEPERFIEPGGAWLLRPESEPVETTLGLRYRRLDQPTPDPVPAISRQHVDVPHSSDVIVPEVGIDAQPTDPDEAAVELRRQQGFAALCEAIRARFHSSATRRRNR
jgi:hypothetical protein